MTRFFRRSGTTSCDRTPAIDPTYPRIHLHVVDEERPAFGDGGADDALADAQAEVLLDVLGVADGVGDVQVLVFLVQQPDRERLERREPRDELRHLLEQLVQIQDRRDLAAQLEQGDEELCGFADRRGRRRRSVGRLGHQTVRGRNPAATCGYAEEGTARSRIILVNFGRCPRHGPSGCLSMTRPSALFALAAAGLVVMTTAGPRAASSAPVRAAHGMVGSSEVHASQAGIEILKAGGNAVDAAVATGFALAVTHPEAGNLGGGGFMVIRLASGKETTIDYREKAPARATRDMFLDEHGNAVDERSRSGPLSCGVPGSVAGLALAEREYGRLTLAKVMAPAIALARDGFAVSRSLADSLRRAQPRLSKFPASLKAFYKDDGSTLGEGDRLVQADLARTLSLIARERTRRLLPRRDRRSRGA